MANQALVARRRAGGYHGVRPGFNDCDPRLAGSTASAGDPRRRPR
jgi:hypothetical protein